MEGLYERCERLEVFGGVVGFIEGDLGELLDSGVRTLIDDTYLRQLSFDVRARERWSLLVSGHR